MNGSTLYRRLPDGTWSAQREDDAPQAVPAAAVARGVPGAQASQAAQEEHLAAEVAAVMAAAGLGAAGSAAARAGVATPPASPQPTPQPAPGPRPAQRGGTPPAAVPGTPPARPQGTPAPAQRAGGAAAGPDPVAAPGARTIASPRRPAWLPRWVHRPRSWKRALLWAAVAYAAWLVFLVGYAAFSLHKVPAAAPVPVADTPGTVWLMVGSDSREGLTAKQRKELRTGGDFGQRTDTIMLLHMSGLGAPTLVSIPRDSWVTIPDYTTSSGRVIPAHQAKVNAAFAEGGAPLLNQTLQDATGLHIDHYAEVGFGGIVGLTDAVGGIRVCVDAAINDVKSGLKLKKGCHNLDGKDALAYVRMRYSDPRGDLGRIERQQEFVSKVMGQVLSWKTVVFPWRQWAIVNAVITAIAVDDRANLFNVSRLGMGLGQVAAGSGEVTTVPTSDSDHWANGQWVLRWDEAAAARLWQSLGAPAR